VERLEALAKEAPEPNRTSTANSNGKAKGHGPPLDVPKYLQSLGMDFEAKTDGDRTKYIIDCPFDADHGKDAAILQDVSGKLGFHCFHDSGADKDWQKFKEKVGAPDAKSNGAAALTDMLFAIVDGEAELWHTPDKKAYATVTVNGHREHWPIGSSGFGLWL